MAYHHFDATKPESLTQNGTQVVQSIRDNQAAALDMILMGIVPGWSMTKAAGDTPATVLYTKGAERRRVSLTWGTTGGEEGNVTSAVYEASYNGGDTYELIGTKVITYAGSGDVTAVNWS